MLAVEGALLLLLLRRSRPIASDVDLAFSPSFQDGVARDIIAGRQSSWAASSQDLALLLGSIGYDLVASPLSWGGEVARAQAAASGFANGLRRHIELAHASGVEDLGADAWGWAKTRAELTSATEVAEAWSLTREEALDEAVRAHPEIASELYKAWDATLDKRTCPICERAHGTIVRIDEPFPDGRPGAVHPRCRCQEQILTAEEAGMARYSASVDEPRRVAPEPRPAPVSVPRPIPAAAVKPAPVAPARVAAPVPVVAPKPRPARAPRPTLTAEQKAAKADARLLAGAERAPVLRHGELDYQRIGMRPESLEYAKQQLLNGDPTLLALKRDPIVVDIWPSGQRVLTDGRHRLQAAQEAGATAIRVHEQYRGPRGGFIRERTVVMRIDHEYPFLAPKKKP